MGAAVLGHDDCRDDEDAVHAQRKHIGDSGALAVAQGYVDHVPARGPGGDGGDHGSRENTHQSDAVHRGARTLGPAHRGTDPAAEG
jgi:hypothetical protein